MITMGTLYVVVSNPKRTIYARNLFQGTKYVIERRVQKSYSRDSMTIIGIASIFGHY